MLRVATPIPVKVPLACGDGRTADDVIRLQPEYLGHDADLLILLVKDPQLAADLHVTVFDPLAVDLGPADYHLILSELAISVCAHVRALLSCVLLLFIHKFNDRECGLDHD